MIRVVEGGVSDDYMVTFDSRRASTPIAPWASEGVAMKLGRLVCLQAPRAVSLL